MSKGKCYSMVDRGQRKKNDAYETPYSITKQFLATGELDDCASFWEPAAGGGAIVRMLRERFPSSPIEETDIENSFLTYGSYHRIVDAIVTNPPYSLALEFILAAKCFATKKIAMLLPLSYLHGQERFEVLWTDKRFPLKAVYVFTRYPLLGEPLREDGKYHTGMQVYAWFVWDKDWEGEPIIRHISNNHFVLRRGE